MMNNRETLRGSFIPLANHDQQIAAVSYEE
jgi:hypothetical protein